MTVSTEPSRKPHPRQNGVRSTDHSLLIATLEATADGILVVDLGGKIVRFNGRFTEMWRIPRPILDSRDDDRAIAFVLSQLRDPDAFVSKVRELYAHPETDSFDVLDFLDGRVFERYSIPQRAGGRVVGRVWSFRDVTERVREERERAAAESRARGRLERLESLWRLLTKTDVRGEALAETILEEGRRALDLDYATLSQVDADGRVTSGASRARAAGRVSHASGHFDTAISALVHGAGRTVHRSDALTDSLMADDPPDEPSGLRAVIGTPLRIGERRFVLGFGSRRKRADPFTHEDCEYVELLAAYFGRYLHMTEQEDQITYLAYHDSLTGLSNRRRFLERVDEASARSRRMQRKFALMYIDLDRFKEINDTLGHTAGDALLAEAGVRLSSVVRAEDCAARVGGDEFAVLLSEMGSPDEAEELARRLSAALSAPYVVENREIQISSSIGIAVFPDDGDSSGSLLDCADAALYRAKEQGRRRLCFYSQEIAARLRRRRQLQSGLHQALERGEFSLVYQPVLRLADRSIEATEALLRWNLPERGVVFPTEFIPAAEETSLMVPIGEWVIRSAARQMGDWLRAGRRWRMAINISVVQLQDPNFITGLKAAIDEAGVPAPLIEIELTESAALRDPDAAQAIVAQCRELGMRVALDDFGTHYASLSHLKKLPVDIIKIDKSFVRGLPQDPNDAAIVRSVLALGNNFSCAVVAEGVENQAQLDWLTQNGCKLAQGFLLGMPMPVDAFESWTPDR
ncbi:MAG TPA: EAL domain-containing protein [Candidatus Eremiobacteraceae bacterium]|nr:EAL domain-containing protein [Candidatus Eremiobacteraceae bacterium]